MNNIVMVHVMCEGQTEEKFVKQILAPYLSTKNIYLTTSYIKKNGAGGGCVKYNSFKDELCKHLHNKLLYVTLFIDFYGIQDWIGYDNMLKLPNHNAKYENFINITMNDLKSSFVVNELERFIPYVSMHEFETLLFSNTQILSKYLCISQGKCDSILKKYNKNPEEINHGKTTAPSKRIIQLAKESNEKIEYIKTATGIAIAKDIGIDKMRKECPHFNNWITTLENLRPL